jgi:hypothetical protein
VHVIDHMKALNDLMLNNKQNENIKGVEKEKSDHLLKDKIRHNKGSTAVAKGSITDPDYKFSIKHLLNKNDVQETYKKNFFILSDELKEEDEEMSVKVKRQILLNKMLTSKSILSKKSNSSLPILEKLINQLYIDYSPDSRKILIDK